MSFSATLIEGQIFKNIVGAVEVLVEAASWKCSLDGMGFRAKDRSNTVFVVAHLKAEAFERYRCDEPLWLSLEFSSLSKILKIAGIEDAITFWTFRPAAMVFLRFKRPRSRRNDIDEYVLRYIMCDTYRSIPADEGHAVDINMPSSRFGNICRDFKQIGDTVEIICEENAVGFLVRGGLCEGYVRLERNDMPETGVFINTVEPMRQSFSLDHLVQCGKAATLSPRVRLSLDADGSLVVAYAITNNQDLEIGYLKYFFNPAN